MIRRPYKPTVKPPLSKSDIFAILCKYRSISRTDLSDALIERGYNITAASLNDFLSKHPDVKVTTDRRLGEITYTYCFDINVCMKPYDIVTDMCKGLNCKNLHICTYFVRGRCSRGGHCKLPHDLSSPSNTAYLRQHSLDKVEPKHIFSRIHFKEGSISICTYYNSVRGCERSDDCNFLHICRRYIKAKCPPSCQYSHSVFDTNCKRVLTTHGIRVDQPVTEILRELKNTLEGGDLGLPIIRPRTSMIRPTNPTPTLSPPPSPIDVPLTLKEGICTYNIRGKCNYNEKCIREHYALPYKWFYKFKHSVASVWRPFTEEEQTEIEEVYCDVSEDSVEVNNRNIPGSFNAQLYFEKMEILENYVVRLSTPSSVTEPPNHPFTTEWIWYWEDNSVPGLNVWRKYTQKAINGSTISDKDSQELEESYQQFLEDPSLSTTMFNVGKYSYRLNFSKMEQESITFTTFRRVRRRPAKLITIQDISRYKKEVKLNRMKGISTIAIAGAGSSTCFPSTWQKAEMFDPEGSFQLVDVKSRSAEFSEIEKMFWSTYPHTIYKIQRVQNKELWEDYTRKRERMNKKTALGTHVKEKRLWHGTREYHTQAICQQNFDFRCSGSSSGTAYGQGSYFARDAEYSARFAIAANNGRRFMFLAKVLVGEYTVGNTSHRRPPEKSVAGKTKCLYDSCVNKISDPSIFVIFDKDQMYPEYLIQY